MNDKKFFISAAVAVLTIVTSIIIYTASTPSELAESVPSAERKELVVAVPEDMPGLIVGKEATFGYHYDIIAAYADAAELPVRMLKVADIDAAMRKLRSGKADVALGVSADVAQGYVDVSLFSSSFVVVGRRVDAGTTAWRKSGRFLPDLLDGGKTLISQGFKSTQSYHDLLDSRTDGEIFVSSVGSVDIAKEIVGGAYDFYICEKSEAQLICALNSNVLKVGEFDEPIVVSATFNHRMAGLREDFSEWLAGYRRSNEFAALTYQYFEIGMPVRLASSHVRFGGSISPYDHVMREVGEREGADWRLMAAIAYCESRFKPDVVSRKGAKGLMQIMPIVARQFGVPDEEVMNPEVNLTLGVKLLNRIESMMKIPNGVSYRDRMSLVLASYNCGVGHVSDARRLAAKHGMNPHSWDDVAYFLIKKAEPEYYGDEVVRNGVFRGSSQTLAFVKSVMGRYSSYCTLAAK